MNAAITQFTPVDSCTDAFKPAALGSSPFIYRGIAHHKVGLCSDQTGQTRIYRGLRYRIEPRVVIAAKPGQRIYRGVKY